MSAPAWVGYEATHRTGSGMLPDSSIPSYLPRDPAGVADDDVGGGGPIFEAGPTTKAARWMCRRGNRALGLPLAVLAAGGYAMAALFFYGMHDLLPWALALLFGYNALKFALVAVWLVLVTIGSLIRRGVMASAASRSGRLSQYEAMPPGLR